MYARKKRIFMAIIFLFLWQCVFFQGEVVVVVVVAAVVVVVAAVVVVVAAVEVEVAAAV